MAHTREQVKAYIAQLQQSSQRAMGRKEFDHGQKLADAAQLLTEWLEQGMPGDMPEEARSTLKTLSPSETRPDAPVLRGQRASYRLIEKLGQGKYGEVWRAEVVAGQLWLEVSGPTERKEPVLEVAAKIMNQGLTRDEKESFFSEVKTITDMQHYERDHGLRVHGYSLIPTVFETVKEGRTATNRAFFVQTLAPGKPIDSLMRERGAFPESQALTIVAQLCQVLDTLHGGTRRSYLDFQPGNVFWNEDTGRILVIDWNLLSKRDDMQVEADVLAAGRLLYRLLMGVPSPLPGSPRMLSQPRDSWEKLSVRAQEILLKALHRNPAHRYTDPLSLRRDLEDLLALWNRSQYDLVKSAGGLIPHDVETGRPLSPREQEQVSQAAWSLSVAEKQDGELSWDLESRINSLKRQIDAWISGRGQLEIGRRQFDALGYAEAVECFERAGREAWDFQTALEAARWRQVALAAQGREGDPLNREHVKHGLDLLTQGDYRKAEALFEQLARDPGAGPFRYLAVEARIWPLLQQAEASEVQHAPRKAAESYRQAAALIDRLPYAGLLQENLGDLKARSASLEEQARADEEMANLVRGIESAFKSSYKDGFERLKKALDQYPRRQGLIKQLKRLGEQYLDQGDFLQARELFVLGLRYAPGDSLLLDRWGLAAALTDAWETWRFSDLLGLENAATALDTVKGGAERRESLLRTWAQQAASRGDYFKVKFVVELLEEGDPDRRRLERQLPRLRDNVVQKIKQAFSDDTKGIATLQTYLGAYPFDKELVSIAEDRARFYLRRREYDHAHQVAELSPQLADLARQAWVSKVKEEVTNSFQRNSTVGIDQLEQYLAEHPNDTMLLDLAREIIAERNKHNDHDTALQIARLSPHLQELAQQIEAEKMRYDVNYAFERISDQAGIDKLRAYLAKEPANETLLELSRKRIQGYLDQKAFRLAEEIARLSVHLKVEAEQIATARMKSELERAFQSSDEEGIRLLAQYYDKRPEDEHLPLVAQKHIHAFLGQGAYEKARRIASAARLNELTRLAEALQSAQTAWETRAFDRLKEVVAEARRREQAVSTDPRRAGKYVPALVKRWFDQAIRDENYAGARSALELMDAADQAIYRDRLESLKAGKKQNQFRVARVNKIAELGRLVLPNLIPIGSAEEPDRPAVESIAELGPQVRRDMLEEMDRACDELIQALPNDKDVIVWIGWKEQIQKAIAGLSLKGTERATAGPDAGRIGSWRDLPRVVWIFGALGMIIALLAGCLSGTFAGMALSRRPTATPTISPTAALPLVIKMHPRNERVQIDQPITFSITYEPAEAPAPTGYNWEFGDGITSSEPNPTHTYGEIGTYTVQVTVTGPWEEKNDTTTVTVVEAPPGPPKGLAIEVAGDRTVGEQVSFKATVTAGKIDTYAWDFGDGTPPNTEANPTHTYTEAGTYTVTLRVTGAGEEKNATTTVTVEHRPIEGLTIEGDTTVEVNQPAAFRATVTAGKIVTYTWKFGDGTPPNTEANPTHTYATTGTYTVTLRATGAGGDKVDATTTVTVVPPAPPEGLAIEVEGDRTVGEQVSFKATVTTGEIVAYEWNFGDEETSEEPNPSHTYTAAGTYTVSVTVTGSGGNKVSATTAVTIADLTPIEGLEIEGDTTVEVNKPVSFRATITAGDNVTYTWEFGDGETAEGQEVEHTYKTIGSFTLTVTASNAISEEKAELQIVVEEPIPGLGIEHSGPTQWGLPTTFTATAGVDEAAFNWDFGDGQTAEGKVVSHTFSTNGTHTVILTARKEDREVSVDTRVEVTKCEFAAIWKANEPNDEISPLLTYPPEETITITYRYKNTGDCTWLPGNVKVVWDMLNDNVLDQPVEFTLTGKVAPDEIGEFVGEIIVPTDAGEYQYEGEIRLYWPDGTFKESYRAIFTFLVQ